MGEPKALEYYTPEVFAASRPQQSGRTAGEKMRLMLGRISLKEGSDARRLMKLLRLTAAVETRNLYNDFVCDQEGEEAEFCKVCKVCKTEDKFDE